jgi:hypothetical protein
MVVQDGPLPGTGIYVGVDFSGQYAFVAEHFLHYTQVGAVFHQMRCK